MTSHDTHDQTDPAATDERRCGHPRHDGERDTHHAHRPHRHGDHRGGRRSLAGRDAHGEHRGQRPSCRPDAHGEDREHGPAREPGARRGHRWLRPSDGRSRRSGDDARREHIGEHGLLGVHGSRDEHGLLGEHGSRDERVASAHHGHRHGSAEHGSQRMHGRPRRLDRRILRTARLVAAAEHRAGRDAVERTMAEHVSHADHEATMRTLRTIARAVRAEHLREGRTRA